MKNSYRHIASTISTIALCSVFSTAQPAADPSVAQPAEAPAAETAPLGEVVPQGEAVPQAEVAAQPEAAPQVVTFDGTEIKGEISGFLKADKSPYLVTEDLIVEYNNVLVIEPGTTIMFKPNTGIIAKGQFVASGTKSKPVTFTSASMEPKPGDWKGIFITGDEPAEISNAVILLAKTGIVIENGGIAIQRSKINSTLERGLYARNANVKIENCGFSQNKGVAVHLSNYSDASIERSDFINNKIAVLNSELANTTLTSSHLTSNEHALVSMDNSILKLNNNKIENNKVGYASSDLLDKSTISSISNNRVNTSSNTKAIVSSIPANPEIPGVLSRPIVASDKIGVLAKQRESKEYGNTKWNVSGSVMLGANYHQVITSKNKGETEVIAGDTITNGSKHKNVFQVPGIQGEASTVITMQSNKGQTIEVSADMTSDTWNHFSPNPVSIRYTDNTFNAVLGDTYKVGSDIYMSGLPLFGIDVTASLLKDKAESPKLELNGFFGEAQRPIIPGNRNPLIYKSYAEDGTATAQRLAYGGSFKVAPVQRFDAKLGFIYANDEIDNPLIRDGSEGAATSDPMISALTAYADGGFKFFPGNAELRGQFAVGRADTTDAANQRAINEIFENEGLEYASYSKLRALMKNESRINQLTQEELQDIFGENTAMSKDEMISELKRIIASANSTKKRVDDHGDRVIGLNWGSQNFAYGIYFDWSYYKTSISTHFKSVGSEFFSAGSPDQLSNTMEYYFNLNQNVKDIWDVDLSYQLNIENADEDNLNGNNRTKYTNDLKFNNTFTINPKFSINVGYNLNFHEQRRATQLHGNYTLEDGIYGDSWFDARSDRPTITINDNGKEVQVDSARWTEYTSLADQSSIASHFQERVYRNTWDLGFTLRAAKSVFKAAGRWTLRTDDSKFEEQDAFVSTAGLSNSTWGKLGYYFHGADYFEQSYPVSVMTTATNVQNSFSVTPRFKSYERDDMKESEISIADDFEIPFKEKFFILGLGVNFRYMSTTWNENDESLDSKEMDLETGLNFRVNHTKNFFSEWNAGFTYYYRPDNLSNEYKDIFGGVRLNYVF